MSRARSPFTAPYRFSPETRPGHLLGPVVKDCTDRRGYPGCIAVAVMARDCTCGDGLSAEAHSACERRAAAAHAAREGNPCDDCAMRPGSPEYENGNALWLAEQGAVVFRCHQGMPFRPSDDGSAPVDFRPRDEKRYPVCNGWAWMRALERESERPDDQAGPSAVPQPQSE